ncbi:uncharacterized protein LOC114533093 isoform X2 [Dendronephthya gigantea]|uniref:uncharacterized protein LOC114533093 isoform X2 n=1 Tax=Dendronephthya gigantea TaxID=151771 RepID=UPI00106B1DF5|nr:uncharacterized protein LOC114533093 isoform X2 [Dendronephthya gigantea]
MEGKAINDCPSPTIYVQVQLSFTDLTNEDVIPAINVTAAQGTTAFQFLQLASDQNPCYLFQYITYPSLGHYITTICCVEQNTTSKFYWFVYINNTQSPVGVDLIKPNNGDVLKFEYRFINSTGGSHSNTTSAGADNATATVSVSVKLTFNNYPDPNVLPPQQIVAPNGTTAFEFLQLASQINPCYIFNYTTFSFGRYITTICCVEENVSTNYYWFIYLNGQLSPVGADLLKPKNGDTLKYEYRLWRNLNHTLPTNSTKAATTSGEGGTMLSQSLNILLLIIIGNLARDCCYHIL